jgi:hypothetical protein
MDRIGLLMGFRGMLSSKSSVPRYRLRGLRVLGGAALVFGLALALQGCWDSSRQNSEFGYGGASDYAAYGYSDYAAYGYSNDPFAFGYDPLLYSYWYPQQYYYYRNFEGDHDRDYDHDCDGGNCGARGGHRPPSPIYPRPLAAPRPMTATRGSLGGGFSSAGGNGSGFHSGFNGAGGFGSVGGFASHGSSHR